MNRLLDKAMSTNKGLRKKKFTQDEIELALAWVNDECSLSGVIKATDGAGSVAAYTFLAFALRQHLLKK